MTIGNQTKVTIIDKDSFVLRKIVKWKERIEMIHEEVCHCFWLLNIFEQHLEGLREREREREREKDLTLCTDEASTLHLQNLLQTSYHSFTN